MNTELKALLSLLFDGLNLGEQIVMGKNVMFLFPQIFTLLQDVPAVVGNLSTLKSELEAMKDPANQADLTDFIKSKVAGSGVSADAQKVVSAALSLVQVLVANVSALILAIEGKSKLKMPETYSAPKKAKWAPGSFDKFAESPKVEEAHQKAKAAHMASDKQASDKEASDQKAEELQKQKYPLQGDEKGQEEKKGDLDMDKLQDALKQSEASDKKYNADGSEKKD